MKKLIFLKMLCLLTVTMFGQDEPIKGIYGSNDVRIRAGNGWIEEGRLNKFDFQKPGLKNIAVLYWSDGNYGFQKLGLTVFGNTSQQEILDSSIMARNKEIVRASFESIEDMSFQLIEQPDQLPQYLKRKPANSQVQILDPGQAYLKMLNKLGFDGLFIIYEDKFQDLITGAKGWVPSKGLFKYGKKELVYYGLYSTLIDLNKLQTVKNIGYKQLSADYSQIPFAEMDSLSDAQKELLMEELIQRFDNNIKEILRIHKLL